MSKQDTIISLLKEIDKNIDNVGGGSDVVPTKRAVIPNMRITDTQIIDGYWAGELIDTSTITTIANMFQNCSQLQNIDVSNWNVSNVTNAYATFQHCSQLQSLDVSNWNVSNVTSVSAMFYNCSQLQSLDVSGWNVSNVTNASSIFLYCSKLQSLIGNLTIDDVLANNIGALNGLKVALSLNNTILDRASLCAIINGLADLTGQKAQTLTLGETLIAKLTEEDIAIATAKNWTIA